MSYEGHPFVGRWVKAIEDNGLARVFVVEVHDDGTATESSLFNPGEGSWEMRWEPTGIKRAGGPFVRFWGDFGHGRYYLSTIKPHDGTMWSGTEARHNGPNEPEEPEPPVQVAFIRLLKDDARLS